MKFRVGVTLPPPDAICPIHLTRAREYLATAAALRRIGDRACEQRMRELHGEIVREPCPNPGCGTGERCAVCAGNRFVSVEAASVPYPEFCRHPDKCAGRSSCPREPTCAD